MANSILDPTGRSGPSGGPADGSAPHLATLSGARIGLLDNTKHNSALFLEELGALLVSEHGAQVTRVEVKTSFSIPIDEHLIDRFRSSCDAVVTGIGDCGSCSAAAVADGISFERAGLPVAVVLTDAFAATGRAMAEVQGAPEYEWISTAHPVAVLDDGEVRARAREVLPGVVASFLGEGVR